MILGEFKPSKAIQKAKIGGGSNGYLTIVNSTKNGKRIEFRKDVAKELNIKDFITVVYTDESAIFFKGTADSEATFRVRESGERKVVYSGSLVAELSEFFNLKFNTYVCHTFVEGRYEVLEDIGETVLVITKTALVNEEKEVKNHGEE